MLFMKIYRNRFRKRFREIYKFVDQCFKKDFKKILPILFNPDETPLPWKSKSGVWLRHLLRVFDKDRFPSTTFA